MILRRWLASLMTRLRGRAAEQEVDDELRTHLEMAVEENLARGMSEREATRAARRSLGVVSSIKEARRQADSLYWLDTLLQDLRYGVRILCRSPRFSVAVVLILGLGVGMTTAVFAIVDSLLLNAVPFAGSHRLVELHTRGPYGSAPRQPAWMVEHWQSETTLFERVEAYARLERVFIGDREPETLQGARIAPGLLRLLGVGPRLGRAFAADESASAVGIISHATWQTRFGGDAGIVGRTLRFTDGALTIVGVMPASFRFPDAHTAFWEPLDVRRHAAADDPRRPAVSVLARLGPGVSFEQADARAAALARQWNAEWIETGQTTRLGPLNELAAQGFAADHWWVRQRRGALFLLFGAVACVLLIACANAANLFLSHALSRRRELAIRAAAGAGRLRLCRQLCTESIVTSFLAGLLGLAFAAWVIRLVATAVPPDLARELLNPIDVDARVASWAVLVSLLAGIAATLPPALRGIGGDLVGAIQGRGAGGTVGHRRFRGGMVVVQNALAVILLIGALLMGRSLWTLLDVDIGWTAENAVALEPRLSGARYAGAEARSAFLEQVAERIAAAPGVEFAAAAEQVPFVPGSLSFGTIETDQASLPEMEVTINHVPSRYFRTAGIPLLQGRGFAPDAAEQDAAIIGRDLAERLWPSGAAIGRRVRMPRVSRLNDGDWLTVVGVAGSIQVNGFDLDRADAYEIYLPWASPSAAGWKWPRFVLVRTIAGADPVGLLKQQVWRLDPELPVTVHVMEDVVGTALAEPRFYLTLLGAFAALAVLLAGAGLYAVVAYETSARTHEIGVRVALGATRGAVIRHLLARSILHFAAGAGVGLLGALALTRLLAPLLYRTSPTDPTTFAAAVCFLLATALAGASLPARRAARADPLAALRTQ